MERFEDAAEAYQRGADLDPSNAQIREGLQAREEAQAEQPKDAAEARLRGNGAYRDGKYEDARRWYSKGLKLLDREEEENARKKEYDNRRRRITRTRWTTMLLLR